MSQKISWMTSGRASVSYLTVSILVVPGVLLISKPCAFVAIAAFVVGLGAVYLRQLSTKTKSVLTADVFQEFELEKKIVVSHNVTIYRFNLPTPESVLGLPISQHVSLCASIRQPDGTFKEISRPYTPISGDDQSGSFDLLIKTYPQGNMTQHLASMTVGQSIRARGPKGNFTYTPNMIMDAIVRGRESGDQTEIDLIYANVTVEDILQRVILDKHAEDPGIRVHYVLDRPPEAWDGGIGYVSADMITRWLPGPAPDIKILLCGPPPMVAALKRTTEKLGYVKSRPVSKLEDQVFAF